MECPVGSEVFEKSLPFSEGQRRRIVLPRTAIQTILEGRDPTPLVRGSKGGRDGAPEPTILTADSREGRRRDWRSHIVSDGDATERLRAKSAIVADQEVDAQVSP